MATSPAARLAIPIGFLLALLLAVGVWIAPKSVLVFLRDPEPPKPIVGPVAGPAATEAEIVPVGGAGNQRDWQPLAALLERFGPSAEPVETPDDDEDSEPTIRPPLNWTYAGFIDSAIPAAVVKIGTAERVIAVGDVVEDPIRGDAEVMRITADRLVVDREGEEVTFQIVEGTALPGFAETRPAGVNSRDRGRPSQTLPPRPSGPSSIRDAGGPSR